MVRAPRATLGRQAFNAKEEERRLFCLGRGGDGGADGEARAFRGAGDNSSPPVTGIN